MSKRRHRTSLSTEAGLSCMAYGVGHNDEGVCLEVRMGKHRLWFDCGLSDLPLLSDRTEQPVELIFCSHAHADHCRSLLTFHENFPKIPIYTSEVTAKLLPLHWSSQVELDSWCHTLAWKTPVEIAPDLSIELFPAGHLPGAAAILATYKTPSRNYKIMYTGDFSVSNFQLVEGLSIESLRGLSPDVLILEGTYGTIRHPHRRQQEKQLMERIDLALNSGNNVLLPVPPIGMGQEILKLLRSHHQFTGRDLDIWVDENVAAACDIYLELLPDFPASVQNFAKHQSLFWDERVCPRMRRSTENINLATGKTPCIAIADYHSDLLRFLSPEIDYWSVFLAEHPQGYLSLDADAIAPFKNLPHVEIETYLLAEHSDGRNTTQLIHNLRPQHVIFVHGSIDYLVELASLEELRNRYQLHAPASKTLVELPIGDRFIQPNTPPPTYYEGELNQGDSVISICLPDTIEQDRRWHKFADTGLIEARWQGEELVLRGISQRELLSSNSETKLASNIECCNSCRYYQERRCRNVASPLYGFKVIPEGYCPVFEPIPELDYK
jgi:Cft2 family RNA processing exonuclease